MGNNSGLGWQQREALARSRIMEDAGRTDGRKDFHVFSLKTAAGYGRDRELAAQQNKQIGGAAPEEAVSPSSWPNVEASVSAGMDGKERFRTSIE